MRHITRRDINGHLDCDVELLADPPEANEFRKQVGSELVAKRQISLKRCHLDYHGMSLKEHQEEVGQMMAETAIWSDEVLMAMKNLALQELQIEVAGEEAEEQAGLYSHAMARLGVSGGSGAGNMRQRGRLMPGAETPGPSPKEAEMIGVGEL